MTQRPRPIKTTPKATRESILPRDSIRSRASEPAAAAAPIEPPAAAPIAAPVQNRGHFQPGNDLCRGKPPRRVPNKLTQDLKQGIIDGAVRHGSNGKGAGGLSGYCYHLAKRHPKAYVSLLAKILPMQVSGNIGHHIDSVNLIPVPYNRFVSGDDIARLANADNVIELEPIEQDNAESQTLPADTESGNED
jgi:hypothetical protein